MRKHKLTKGNALLAKCHECMGHYSDGRQDCECTQCPLYTWMPYKKKTPNLDWLMRHFRRVGIILLGEVDPKKIEHGRRMAAKNFGK